MTERDIEIVEVSPSDGLQNDKVTFSTEAKAKLIARGCGRPQAP